MNAPTTIARTATPTPLAAAIMRAVCAVDRFQSVEIRSASADEYTSANNAALEARRSMLAAFADLGVTAAMIRQLSDIL
jgi:hypothetical protein